MAFHTLGYFRHKGLFYFGGEEDVHGAILRIFLVFVVVEEALDRVFRGGDEIDGIEFWKGLAWELKPFDCVDAEVHEPSDRGRWSTRPF